MTRRPVRGLAPIQAAPVNARPPGPATILGPDGRTWHRDETEGLYYDEARREVYSQAALRDLIDRAAERLLRAMSRPRANPLLRPIATARSVAELERLYRVYRDHWSDELTTAALGRRAVLELPPKAGR
jgi:hypothetical protein